MLRCLKTNSEIRLNSPHYLLKYNHFQKEIFMKTKLTKCLLMGALAIGMSSTAMAEEHSKTEKLCDEATLIGRYHMHVKTAVTAGAGQYVFDGAGHGVATFTIHWLDPNKTDPVIEPLHFNYSVDTKDDCKFNLQGFLGQRTLYVAVNGDSASVVTDNSVNSVTLPVAYEITRGPISHNND
jgi:hypothetical protein